MIVHGALQAAQEREAAIAKKRAQVVRAEREAAFSLWYAAKRFEHWMNGTVPMDDVLRRMMCRDWPSIAVRCGELRAAAKRRARIVTRAKGSKTA